MEIKGTRMLINFPNWPAEKIPTFFALVGEGDKTISVKFYDGTAIDVAIFQFQQHKYHKLPSPFFLRRQNWHSKMYWDLSGRYKSFESNILRRWEGVGSESWIISLTVLMKWTNFSLWIHPLRWQTTTVSGCVGSSS